MEKKNKQHLHSFVVNWSSQEPQWAIKAFYFLLLSQCLSFLNLSNIPGRLEAKGHHYLKTTKRNKFLKKRKEKKWKGTQVLRFGLTMMLYLYAFGVFLIKRANVKGISSIHFSTRRNQWWRILQSNEIINFTANDDLRGPSTLSKYHPITSVLASYKQE